MPTLNSIRREFVNGSMPAADLGRVCRRLRLPFLAYQYYCEGCGAVLDKHGDHYASCMWTGRVQARAKPLELTWAQVLREAGATVHVQKLLGQTTLSVDPSDTHRIDALASGLPLYMGRPLFCDATIRSPLHADGTPYPRADSIDGVVLQKVK